MRATTSCGLSAMTVTILMAGWTIGGAEIAGASDSKSGASARGSQSAAPVPDGAPKAAVAAHRSRHARSPVRVHSSPRTTRHGVYFGWSPYWGASWSGYWGGYWDPYWYGPRLGYTAVYPRAGEIYGALDTDISPERAEVWIDGRKIGVADDFDGFPTYLWLEKGTYDVVFYLPGFKTLARQYSIYPGLVIDVEDRLERGEAVHPLDLGPATTVRRDERLRRDRERRERLAAEAPAWDEAPGSDARRSDDWLDVRTEPGRLRIQVAPADASIYLDGRFVGTGADLDRLRSGLLLDSGLHTLEIVRPGFHSERREIEISRGEQSELRIDLEQAPETRR